MMRIAQALAICGLMIALGWTLRGWRDGAAETTTLRQAMQDRAEAQAAAHRAAEAASRAEVQRLATEAERNALAQQLEDMANADDSGGGLPRVRVDRLRQR